MLPIQVALLKQAAVSSTFILLYLNVFLQLVLEFIFVYLQYVMQRYQDWKLNPIKIYHCHNSTEGTTVPPNISALDDG